jgi:hypothetical protein
VPNKVGKITTKVYAEYILLAIKEDLQKQGLTFCQDADLAYINNATIAWAKKHNLPLLILPRKSPDLSILESEAHELKKKFHAIRSIIQKAGLARFTRIFEEEMAQEKI